MDWTAGVRFPAKAMESPLLHSVQTCCEAHSVSYSVATEGSSSGGTVIGAWSYTLGHYRKTCVRSFRYLDRKNFTYFGVKNISNKRCRERWSTHFMFTYIFSKCLGFRDNWMKVTKRSRIVPLCMYEYFHSYTRICSAYARITKCRMLYLSV
jgi:hypothetical protein